MIQSEIKQEAEQEQKYDYPLLMIGYDDKYVVLMTSHGKGTLLHHYNSFIRPHHCEVWDMSKFKPFKGEITLKNKLK